MQIQKPQFYSSVVASMSVLRCDVIMQVMMNSLWFDKDLKNATDTARIHHQLTPNKLFVEDAVLQVRFADGRPISFVAIKHFCRLCL